MRKFFLTGSIVIIFALYVWRVSSAPSQILANFTPPALDRSVLPSPQEAQPQPAAPQPPAAAEPPPTTVVPPTQPVASPAPAPRGQYRDGTYRGYPADAYYGMVQVAGVISGGRLTNVQILSYPNDRSHSVRLNQYALPILMSEAVQAQSAQVNIVSGATDSSMAFRESLASALSQARN